MRLKMTALAAAALLGLTGLAPGNAAPTLGGLASDNVEYVQFVPFELGTATGANIWKVKNKTYMVVTSWKSFSIYDVSNPVAPVRISTTPFGFQFENEDVATNGEIMLFSEQIPIDQLHVWDLESLAQPREIATLEDNGDHTTSCLMKCRYAWGSSGSVTDLFDPRKPKDLGSWLGDLPANGSHDVVEVANGLVLTASQPIMFLDARKSRTDPKLLAIGSSADRRFVHSIGWPRGGKDRFILAAGETNADTRCNDDSAKFMVWDTKNWKKTGQFKMTDEYKYRNGTFVDGNPPVNGLGCSSHWFSTHRTWKDGGLVAVGSYEHGTRFITVNSKGKMTEVGWFVPFGGSTSAAYWLDDKIVYNIDYSRGIDILRYKGKLR